MGVRNVASYRYGLGFPPDLLPPVWTALPPCPTDRFMHLSSQVFLLIEPLHPALFPAHVTRHRGMTAISIDPESLRAELAFWFPENLTDDEHAMVRGAYGCTTPLDRPPPDRFLEGRMSDSPVPEALCLPQRPLAESA